MHQVIDGPDSLNKSFVGAFATVTPELCQVHGPILGDFVGNGAIFGNPSSFPAAQSFPLARLNPANVDQVLDLFR
jgi:hypothetical protein